MILRNLIQDFLPLLDNADVENALRELRLIIAHVLSKTYEEIYFGDDQKIGEKDVETIKACVNLRCQHMPLAKILGQKEFWGMPFLVTMDTLDPRPESETLIEAIELLVKDASLPLRILDLGTGTGCLLLSALSIFPQATGVGVDLSNRALHVAKKNALRLGGAGRSEFIFSDWFEGVSGTFDIILSNPPYIPEGTSLSLETLHDPASALFAPEQGLLAYRLILEQAAPYLKSGGYLVFEIGAGQAFDVIDIALQNHFKLVLARKDLLGHTRCLVFNK